MLSRLLWKAYLGRPELARYIAELAEFETQCPAVSRNILARRLLRQIQHFGSRADALPEWREAARIHDPDEIWRIWPYLPIVRKTDLQNRFHPAAMRETAGVTGCTSSTGGSTGEPTHYVHDQAMLLATTAARLYSRIRMGWRPGQRTICAWGSERDIGRQRSRRNRVSSYLRNENLIDGYCLNSQTVDRVLEILKRERRVAMFGFSSILEFLSREVIRRDQRPAPGRVTIAWNGGEMLFENQIHLFEAAFGVPVLNLFGGRELSVLAYQSRVGEALTVMRPLIHLELINERNLPAAPGEPARVICTSTVCRGTPFLRYEIGDLATFDASGADESGIRALSSIQGRDSGLLELPNGKTVNCIYWNHLFKEFDEIHQFQVVLHRGRDLTLRFRGPGFGSGRETKLRHTLSHLLNGGSVEIEWRDALPLTAQGKLVHVVRT